MYWCCWSLLRLISGTLRCTPLRWLPVLSNIEPPALRRNAATDKLVEKIVKHDSWPIHPNILNPPIHHCYDWHPGSRCGWTYNQLTSKVDGGITWSWLRWSSLTQCVTPQSSNQVLTFLSNSGLCWTVFARNRDTAVPVEGNGDLQTLICVLAERPRWCPTILSNPVLWQSWMAAYPSYILQMKTLFPGCPIMVHYTDTRRRTSLYKETLLLFVRLLHYVMNQLIYYTKLGNKNTFSIMFYLGRVSIYFEI